MIQNGVKYNTYKGDLIFLLSLRSIKRDERGVAFGNDEIRYDHYFELEIIDTGRGIEEER